MNQRFTLLILLILYIGLLAGCNGTSAMVSTENRIRLEHVAINVKDPVKMADWYCKNLGMKLIRSRKPPYNTRFFADAGGNMMLEIYSNPDVAVLDYWTIEPGQLHIAFMVDDVKGIRDKLVAAGAKLVMDVVVTDDGDEIIMLRDPWGVPIQFLKRGELMMRHN